jgi:glucose/arabinose dehydrogenase
MAQSSPAPRKNRSFASFADDLALNDGRLAVRKLFRILFILAAGLASLARAQHPEASSAPVEKPWPRVGFLPVLDARKYIASLGQTYVEDGDTLMYLTNAGDGSNRIFIVERMGRIWIMQNGALLPKPFLDITALMNMYGEHGLYCVAFPPGAGPKDHCYVTFANLNGDNTLARVKVDPHDPNHALAESVEVLLVMPHPRYTNHYGGQVAFGKDGMLYWSLGDGGGQYDPNRKAQSLQYLNGKLLRLDVEGAPDPGKKYRVPPDNPFVKTPGARPEIWALGLRNPWRFSFDSANGDLYIANVGEYTWESIYYEPAGDKGGENYGWSIYESSHPMHPDETQGTSGPITFPVAEFSHNNPDQLHSITGGYVYRGADYPDWQGIYFFSDWVNSEVWALRRDAEGQWQSREVDGGLSPVAQTVSMGVDEKGNIYALGFADGVIYKLVPLPTAK